MTYEFMLLNNRTSKYGTPQKVEKMCIRDR